MTRREHIFSFGHPGFQCVCNPEVDGIAVKITNARIIVSAVAEQLKKADVYVEANLRWSCVDIPEFVQQCRANDWSVKEIESEEVFQETCLEVRRPR